MLNFLASPLSGPFESGAGRNTRQRSFNWQSTAFVMRGLRVRLPSLALSRKSLPPCNADQTAWAGSSVDAGHATPQTCTVAGF